MKSIVSAAALAAAALVYSTSAGAATVSFTPSMSTIDVGGSTTITMSISGLGNEILSGWDFNIIWTSAIVSLAGADAVVDCSVLDVGAGSLCFDAPSAGNYGNVGVSFDSDAALAANQADSLVIGTFKFFGVAGGTTTVGLDGGPDFDRNFTGLNNGSLTISVETAEICVRGDLSLCGGLPGVPEPASYGLAGVALLAASWASRGRRRTVKAA